jgi:hypothetical protein
VSRKRHLLHGHEFVHFELPQRLVLIAAIIAFTIAAFWCNTIFAFAIDAPPPPRIAPAARQARSRWRTVLASGLVVGGILAIAVITIPRFVGVWAFRLSWPRFSG